MEPTDAVLMVTAAGADRPGITARLMGVLAAHGVDLVDIRQVSFHDRLWQSLVLAPGNSTSPSDQVMKDLLMAANELDLSMNFHLVGAESALNSRRRGVWVLTHFGGTGDFAELARVLAEEQANIEGISSSYHHDIRSMELTIDVNTVPHTQKLKERIMAWGREFKVDLGIQTLEAFRKNKRLIFFDVDSTLVDMEIIDEMAREAGVYHEVSRVTERAMRGEFDFEESLIQRVALLKGLHLDRMEAILGRMTLSEGAEDLVTTLKWLGFTLGMISGGFDFFTDHLKDRFGFDFAAANRLEIRNGRLTGTIEGDVVDAAAKARFVNRTACDLNIGLDQTVVAGDGANDALMLGQAGLGIAYNAKKRLDRVANAAVGKRHMRHVFHLLGITEEDIVEACQCKSENERTRDGL